MDADTKFTDPLDKQVDVRYLNNGMYLLLSQIEFQYGSEIYRVEPGFESDGFTIPKWFRWALPKIPKRGFKASILHDFYCHHDDVPRHQADLIFKEALDYLDVKTRRVHLYYKGVSLYTKALKIKKGLKWTR